MSVNSEYLDGVVRAWRGEKAAAVTLQFLATMGLSDRDTDLAKQFCEVEGVIADELEGLLLKHGRIVETDDELKEAAIARAERLAGWQAVVESLDSRLELPLEEFRQLLAKAPQEDVQVVTILVEHELALISFGSLLRANRFEEARQVLTPFTRRAETE